MAFYKTTEQFYEVMRGLFQRLRNENGAERAMRQARLILRLRTTEPEAVITINGRQNPIEITYGENHVQPDLDMSLPADLLHDIFLNRVGLRDSFLAGKIQVQGAIFRAFGIGPLFEYAERLYPQVLAEQGFLPGGSPA